MKPIHLARRMQGYLAWHERPACDSCAHIQGDIRAGKDLRCGVGGFWVARSGWCPKHEDWQKTVPAKTGDLSDFPAKPQPR